MSEDPNSGRASRERFVVAYTADTLTEAVVIRSLLEGAGIHSPTPGLMNPLELPLTEGLDMSLQIFVAESQAEEARQIIEDYAEGNAGQDSAAES